MSEQTTNTLLNNLVDLAYKDLNLSSISIDSSQLHTTMVSGLKLRLVWEYINEYMLDDAENCNTKITSIIAQYGVSTDYAHSAAITSIFMSGGADLIAGNGLQGDTYNTTTSVTWELGDITGTPTDSVFIQSDI